MTTLATFSSLAQAASNGLIHHAHDVCRGLCLPRTASVMPRVAAIVSYYRRETGRHLDTETAIRVLDRLQAERDDMPFPAAYAAVADYLHREGYTNEAIHETIGHLRRFGTTKGLGSWLAPGHRDEVLLLAPEPQRGQWGHGGEDEDGDE